MSDRIHELLNRNLREVFGEGDAARRRAAIEELYTDDCVLYGRLSTDIGHAQCFARCPGKRDRRSLARRLVEIERPRRVVGARRIPLVGARLSTVPAMSPGEEFGALIERAIPRTGASAIRAGVGGTGELRVKQNAFAASLR